MMVTMIISITTSTTASWSQRLPTSAVTSLRQHIRDSQTMRSCVTKRRCAAQRATTQTSASVQRQVALCATVLQPKWRWSEWGLFAEAIEVGLDSFFYECLRRAFMRSIAAAHL